MADDEHEYFLMKWPMNVSSHQDIISLFENEEEETETEPEALPVEVEALTENVRRKKKVLN